MRAWCQVPEMRSAHDNSASGVSGGLALAVLALVAYPLASAEAAASHARATPRCATSGLAIHVREFSGSNSEVAEKIEFTNVSHHRCELAGHPRVAAVDRKGRRLGAPAALAPGAVKLVRLKPGRTTGSILRIVRVETESSGSGCEAVGASALRIYPPGARLATLVRWKGEVCRNPNFRPGFFGSVMEVSVVGAVR